MLTLNDGRSELWQWDTGRTLSVPDDCSQVHFSNKVFGRSVDVDVVNGEASIPDILLQTDKELTAWAFVGASENGYTKISKVFKVNKRNKPADYVFTPTDQTTLGEILDRIEDLENRPSGDISKEDIQNAVNDYLDKNPVSFDEKDPTVPAWAKKPNKPTYTASEVGALPVDTVIPEGGIPIPPAASVGQTIVVKEVDENGKPTEWEAADMASGGRTPTLLTTFELAEGEEVNSITIDACDDGTTFADAGWRKIGVRLTTQGASDLTDYQNITILVNGNHAANGYGVLAKALYTSQRRCYFTIEAQGCAIEMSYKVGYAHFSQGAAISTTNDIISISSTTSTVYDKITKIQLYNNSFVMLYGTKIEVWGIE